MKTQRTIGLIVLSLMVVFIGSLVGLIAWAGPAAGMVVFLLLLGAVIGCYVMVIGPWQRRWGTIGDEARRPMPGDEILGPTAKTTTRAVGIEAPPEVVFPWLLQIGYERGGWYSYDWIDNDGRPSADRIDPELQRLAVGDRIQMMPGLGPVVRAIERDHYIVSGGEADSWCLLVEGDAAGGSRLISRWRQNWPLNLATRIWVLIADPGSFVMERKMLVNLRRLATLPRLRPDAAGNAERSR